MSKELQFDGHWEGETIYSCDCCGKKEKFRFECEDDLDYKTMQAELRKKGWIFTKVNERWKDFCSEKCRNEFIRKNTI